MLGNTTFINGKIIGRIDCDYKTGCKVSAGVGEVATAILKCNSYGCKGSIESVYIGGYIKCDPYKKSAGGADCEITVWPLSLKALAVKVSLVKLTKEPQEAIEDIRQQLMDLIKQGPKLVNGLGDATEKLVNDTLGVATGATSVVGRILKSDHQ